MKLEIEYDCFLKTFNWNNYEFKKMYFDWLKENTSVLPNKYQNQIKPNSSISQSNYDSWKRQ